MFADLLKKVVDNVDGGVGGVIMGLDGIAVETYTGQNQNVDPNTIGMEFSFILTQVRKAAEILEVGGLGEMAIKAERLTMVMKMLSEEYFFAILLSQGANFGKCRFLMRMATPKLLAEL